ncbi:uncharacterized protein I206_104832 [Kwoniella pini CBS 10737]|uniref:N-alpha-acetyltransferase 40 n=1 Tax=Kwoniella pini CBS 10737 TaxID=1296096 RepID=A0A1B9I800_9TREE|nr:uncharacterized protein I206_02372 [Kwoniella pini CBS 10737]OCF51657.1 hypothetical protein I206_02372 [Kwoniella pini CBS 10737]
MATLKIRLANSASTSTLSPNLPKIYKIKDNQSYEISLVKSKEISEKGKKAIYKLFDENMSKLQQISSFPYTEESKFEELFNIDSRYILILKKSNKLIIEKEKEKEKGKDEKKENDEIEELINFNYNDLIGFCGFRFDTEETIESRDAEVIYCYEVQLENKSRRMGLGKILLNILEEIGKKRELDKIMLTCLKSNETALAFYTKQGYIPDEIDPTGMEEESSDIEEGQDEDGQDEDEDEDTFEWKVDYRILSKSLKDINT